MQIPPKLTKGDSIGIVCSSGHLDFSKTIIVKQTLENWGFHVILGKTVGSGHGYFSETDENRLADLQEHLDNPEIKAIIMGRGGYGLSRIIDAIDFTKFKENPKWINGFSDITVLHSHINNQLNIATIHGPMCSAFQEINTDSAHLLSLKQAFLNERIHYPIPMNEHNKPGNAKGILIGGNLAILAHLTGSVSELKTKGKILFIEDVDEYLYNIDRMLLNLKRAGFLDKIIGLICGEFSEIKDTDRPFGQSLYEIILDKVKEYNIPVCFNFPAGHIDNNYALCLGKSYEFEVNRNGHATLINCGNNRINISI